MSREYHLHFNPYTYNYIFVEGPDFSKGSNRQEWEKEKGPKERDENGFEEWEKREWNNLRKKLTSLIDPERRTILHLVDIPRNLEAKIEEFYAGTNVQVEYKSKKKQK